MANEQSFCHLIPIRLRLSPTVEPSSTVVSLEWVDVQPAIGTKVSDYILQHKKVDEYTDTDLYTGKYFSLCGVGETRFSNVFSVTYLEKALKSFGVIFSKQQQHVIDAKSSSDLDSHYLV